MRIFLTVLILIFNLQSWSKADDIRDFEIEGLSIGDSLLERYDEDYILTQTNAYGQYPGSNTFVRGQFYKNVKEYDALIIHYRKKDKKYKIYGISGVIDFRDSIQDCYEKMNKIEFDLNSMTSSLEKKSSNNKHRADESGKSTYKTYSYNFKTYDAIQLQCYDWSENTNFTDHLRLNISHHELRKWIQNEAYK